MTARRYRDSSWHKIWVLCVFAGVAACADKVAPSVAGDGGLDAGALDASAHDGAAHDSGFHPPMYPLDPPGPCIARPDAGMNEDGDTDAGSDGFERIDWRHACAHRCEALAPGMPAARSCAISCEQDLDLADQACGECYLHNLYANGVDCTYGCSSPGAQNVSTKPLWACEACAATIARVGAAGCSPPSRAFSGRAPDAEALLDEGVRLKTLGPDIVAIGQDSGLSIVQGDLSLTPVIRFDTNEPIEDIVMRADGVWVAYADHPLESNAQLIELTRDGTILRRVTTVSIGALPIALAAAPSGLIAAASASASVRAIDAEGASTELPDERATFVTFDSTGDWLLLTTGIQSDAYATHVHRVRVSRSDGAWLVSDYGNVDITGPFSDIYEQHLAIDGEDNRILFRQLEGDYETLPRKTLSKHLADGSTTWSQNVEWIYGTPLIAPDNAIVMATSGPIGGAGFVVYEPDGSERFHHIERGPVEQPSLAIDSNGNLWFAFVTREQTNAAQLTSPRQPRLLKFTL